MFAHLKTPLIFWMFFKSCYLHNNSLIHFVRYNCSCTLFHCNKVRVRAISFRVPRIDFTFLTLPPARSNLKLKSCSLFSERNFVSSSFDFCRNSRVFILFIIYDLLIILVLTGILFPAWRNASRATSSETPSSSNNMVPGSAGYTK